MAFRAAHIVQDRLPVSDLTLISPAKPSLFLHTRSHSQVPGVRTRLSLGAIIQPTTGTKPESRGREGMARGPWPGPVGHIKRHIQC